LARENNFTSAGTIVRAHGTAGVVVFESDSILPQPGDLFMIEHPGEGFRPYRTGSATPTGKGGKQLFFLKFVDIDNRTAAEALRGARVSEYPGSAYNRIEIVEAQITDVTGYTVTDSESGIEGYVSEVIDNPAHPLLEIQLDSGLILLPFVDAYITGIDHGKKLINARNLDMFTGL
jgi:ribosomal 30S subunit maturation factor RimM